MRSWALFVIAGCGRIAFDAAGGGGDAFAPGDGIAPPSRLTCANGWSDLPAVPADADLVANLLDDRLGLGWIDRSQESVPQFAVLDTNLRIVGDPVPSPLNAGTRLDGLVYFNGELYIDSSLGTQHVVTKADAGFANIRAFVTEQGVPGRDCLLTDSAGNRGARISGDGMMLAATYLASPPIGPSLLDETAPVASLACYPGADHAHAVWSTTTGSCRMVDLVLTAGLQPGFGNVVTGPSMCADPRATVAVFTDDTTSTVWRSGDSVRTTYATVGETGSVVFGQEITLSPSGRGPRISSDGQTLWHAWLDTRTGRDELRISYQLPNMLPVDEAVVPVTPAGDESYELVFKDGSVFLLAITAGSTPGLAVYELCK